MTTRESPEIDETCAQIGALLAHLGADDPAPDALAMLEAHLTGCATCGEAEAALATLIRRYREAAAPPLPAQLEQRILDRLCGRV